MTSPLVMIGVPTTGQIEGHTVSSIVGALVSYPNPCFKIQIGTYIAINRDMLMRQAKAVGCDYLLFIDSDMIFPVDTIQRLINHKKVIVGANYRQRRGNNDFSARKNNAFVSSEGPDKTGLEDVEFMGFGVCLIDLSILEKIPEPWFEGTSPEGFYLGEDVAFCDLVREAGEKVWIDHDLSKQVGHLAQTILTAD